MIFFLFMFVGVVDVQICYWLSVMFVDVCLILIMFDGVHWFVLNLNYVC